MAAGCVPRIERYGGASESMEGCAWLTQIHVIALGTVEVLAGEGESQLAGIDAGAVAVFPGGERVTLIELLVEDGAAEFGVVGPRAPVEVVRAH